MTYLYAFNTVQGKVAGSEFVKLLYQWNLYSPKVL